jgi:hypothetical protein
MASHLVDSWLERWGSPDSLRVVSALEVQIAETLKSLDPPRARAFERAIYELLSVVRPNGDIQEPAQLTTPVDANGWPQGYWDRFAGCWADLEYEASSDPAPEPHPF